MTHSDSRPKQDLPEHPDQAFPNLEDLRQAGHASGEHGRQLDSPLGLLPGSAYRALPDEHWTALFVSKGIEDLTGYPPDELTSRRLRYNDIMLSGDRSAAREAVLTALRERRMYDVEHRIRHKDGSVRWIWSRGRGVFPTGGSLRFIEVVEPGQSTPEAAGWEQRALFGAAWRQEAAWRNVVYNQDPRAHARRNS